MNEHKFNPEKQPAAKAGQIFDASPEDARAIAVIRKRGWETTYVDEEKGITRADIDSRGMDDEDRIQRHQERLKEPSENAHTWVVKVESQVVGFCEAVSGDYNEIKAVYILPEFQSQGHGQQLMQQAIEWIGRDKDIYLDVVDFNTRAIELYKRLGFELTDKREFVQFKSGKFMQVLVMIKRHD
ncbi:MAG: GNAT family N-acetyltransferase [Candidatus Doudnabacteria bacterium]|nr:GNAT family N-acetyltransferase [Candidatus Doudnabacteria bacterium]